MEQDLSSRLCYSNIDFDITDVFPETWLERKEFSLYKSKPRPCSALFFVCSPIEVSFFEANGDLILGVQKGDVLYIPKGMQYSVSVLGETGTKIDTYTINLTFYDEIHRDFSLLEHPVIAARHQETRMELQLKRLSDAFHQSRETPLGRKPNLARIKGEFFLLLDTISSTALQNDDVYYPIRKGVEAFCDEWNQNEKIEKYAHLSGVSETYFYRCFRKWSGKTPIEYRNMVRLSNAESLLRSTDMQIQKIAQTVGYDDPFYFSRIFMESYGMSPKHYRKQHQQE